MSSRGGSLAAGRLGYRLVWASVALAIVGLCLLATAAMPQAPPAPIPVIFAYHISDAVDRAGGPFRDQNNHPLIQSAFFNVKWATVAPSRCAFDWTLLDKKIEQWTGTSTKTVVLKFAPYGGDPIGEEGSSDDNDTTPAWVYDTVPPIAFTGGGDRPVIVPKVWDPTFYPIYEEFIAALAARYNADPRVSGYILGIGHNGNLQAQGSRGGGTAFRAAGWTLPIWEQHVRTVVRLSKAHLTKPLTIIKTRAFLDGVNLSDNPDAARRIIGEAALEGVSPLLGGLAPTREDFVSKSFNVEIVSHLANLTLPAGVRIGFYDDWPLWVPPSRSEKCPGSSCGRNLLGFETALLEAVEVWNSIGRKYPIYFAFLAPESKATNPTLPPCVVGGDFEKCYYKALADVAAAALAGSTPPPPPPPPASTHGPRAPSKLTVN